MNLKIISTPAATVTGFLIVVVFSMSCASSKNAKDGLYFQRGLDSITNIQLKQNVIQVNDVISIKISSQSSNQEQVQVFKVQEANNYLVNTSGNIELPVIGTVKAAGLTKLQLQSLLIEKISPYVKSPLVAVDYVQFKVNVMGQVNSPGTKSFQTDRVTIIDAINAAGDIGDFGRKDNVKVIREEDGKRKYYIIDMSSGALFQSPVYLMQPNDIIYVEPNKFKLREINTDPNRRDNQRYYVAFIAAASAILSLIFAITRATK